MAGKVTFELVSPEKLLLSTEADMVVVPGSEGDFAVLVHHIPVITNLRPGVIQVFEGQTVRERIMVSGGFAEVTGERCTVLVEEAIPFADVSPQWLDNRMKLAETALADATDEHAKHLAENQISVTQAMRRVYDYYAAH
ncbi:MAG: ATP synthase F1 subunit epsilon [Rhodospirillales bacterium]